MNWLRKWFYSGLSTGGFWIAKKLGYQFVLLGVISALLVEGVYRKDYSTGIEIDVLLVAVFYIGFQALLSRLSKLLLTDYGYLGALRRYCGFVFAYVCLLLLQYSWQIDYAQILRVFKLVNLSLVFPIINGFKNILEVQSAQLFSINKKQGLADVPDFNRININRTVFSIAIVSTLIFIECLVSDIFLPQDYLWVAIFGMIGLFQFNLTDNIKSGNHGLAIQEVKPPNLINKKSKYLRSNYFRLIYLSTLIILIFSAIVFSMELEKLTLNHELNFQRFISLVIWFNIFIVVFQEFGKVQLRRIKTTVNILIVPFLTVLFSVILVANRIFGEEQSLFYNFAISVLFIVVWVGGANISEAMLDVALNHCSAAEKFATRRILTGYKIRVVAVAMILIPLIIKYLPWVSLNIPINEFLIFSSLILSLVWFNLSRGIAKIYTIKFTTLKENLQLSAIGYPINRDEKETMDESFIIKSEPNSGTVHPKYTQDFSMREFDTQENKEIQSETVFIDSEKLDGSKEFNIDQQKTLNQPVDTETNESNTIGNQLDGVKVLPATAYFEKYGAVSSVDSTYSENKVNQDKPKSPYRNLLQILSENSDFPSVIDQHPEIDAHTVENLNPNEIEALPAASELEIQEIQIIEKVEERGSTLESENFDIDIHDKLSAVEEEISLPEEIIEDTIISGSRIVDLGRLLNSNELSNQFQAIDIIKTNKYTVNDILSLISYSPVALRNQIFKQWDQNSIVHSEHDLYPKFVGLLKDTSELLVWLQINISEIHGQSVEDLFMLSNMYYLSKQVQSQIIQILSFNLGIKGAQRVENYLNNIETDTDVVFNLELLGEILPSAVKPYLLPIYEPTTFAQKIEQWRQLIPMFSGDLNERYLDIALKDFSLIPVSIKFWALRILHKKQFNSEKLVAFRKSNITSLRAAVSPSSSKFGTSIERFIGKAEVKSVEDVFMGSEILVDWLNSFESEKKLRDSKENPEVIFSQRKSLIKKYLQ